MPTGEMFLTLINTSIDLITLFARVATCSFHFKSSLIMTPENLVEVTLVTGCASRKIIIIIIICYYLIIVIFYETYEQIIEIIFNMYQINLHYIYKPDNQGKIVAILFVGFFFFK